MTTPNSNQPTPVHYHVHHPPSNGLGVAGFVTSLVGLISCGIASPIGLVLSLIALTKTPRGFAIAGTIIGAVGSFWLAIAGFAMVLAMIGVGAGVKAAGDYIATFNAAHQAYVSIDSQNTNGDITSATANSIAQKVTDPWGTPLQAAVSNNRVTITSAGKDKQFGTSDDVTFSQSELQTSTPPTTNPVRRSAR